MTLGKIVKTLALSVFIISLSSCATWKGNATTAYQGIGLSGAEICSQAKGLCENNTLKETDCIKIKILCNKARESYIVAGNALSAAIETDSAITKNQNMTAYTAALNELTALIPEIVKLAASLGITGGVK